MKSTIFICTIIACKAFNPEWVPVTHFAIVIAMFFLAIVYGDITKFLERNKK